MSAKDNTRDSGAVSPIVPAYPPIVYIEPTNACNCACIICPRRVMTRPIGRIAMELFRSVVDQVAALGPSEIRLFNFGEPLLHSGLADMIRHCRMRKLKVNFQTNGLLLTGAAARGLLEAGLDYFGVSVNGLTPAEYATIRPGCQIETLRRNLAELKRLAAALGRKVHVHLNAQILKEDQASRQADIRTFLATWHGLADSLSISGLSRFDRIAYLHQGRLEESVLAELPRKPDEAVACLEPFDRMIVKWDGRVTVCCADYDARWVVGDVRRQPLADIWRSPEFEQIRAVVAARRYSSHPLCRTCPKLYSDEFSVVFQRGKAPGAGPGASGVSSSGDERRGSAP